MKAFPLLAVFCFFFLQARTQGIITTIAGNGITQYIGDGWPATTYSLAAPSGIVADKLGNIYITDYADSRIRRLSRDTLFTINDTSGIPGYSGDGAVLANARFNNPSGLCIDTSGNLFIAEEFNNVIRRVDRATSMVTTLVGTTTGGYSGDGGAATAAQMNQPEGICLDKEGNIYIADKGNNRVRKVNLTTGVISSVAGTGSAGYSGDNGPATAAKLSSPWGVAVDTNGNIYIADHGNNRIRKVDANTNIITTAAGTGTGGYSGDGGNATAAKLMAPNNVFIDIHSRIYISDQGNNVIRRVGSGGAIITVAGNGSNGYSGDDGPATAATLYGPTAVFVNDSGTIFIADGTNSVIRKVSSITTAVSEQIMAEPIKIYPNPSSGIFVIERGVGDLAGINVFNMLGQNVYNCDTRKTVTMVDISSQPAGFYLVSVCVSNARYNYKILLQK